MPESGPPDQPDEATIDLLVKQVTEGLSPAEQRELEVLDDAVASDYLRDLEKAAAALALAGAAPVGEPPAELQSRIEREAVQQLVALTRAGTGHPAPRVAVPKNAASSSAAPLNVGAAAASRARGGMAGWFAAAACLLLAIFFWMRAPRESTAPIVVIATPPPVSQPLVVTPKAAPAPPTDAQLRDELLARADAIKANLGATKDPAAVGVSGDVVWDPATQRGFMHFVGLAPNDPRVRQYQAWIFDKERDARYPVDAGLFDVAADATEIIIPIHAAVPVRTAAAFAVTVEKAGGAVVSAREHVVVLGKAS